MVVQQAPASIYITARGAFSWPVVATVIAIGLVGLALSRWIGIPDTWSPSVSARIRFLWPIVAGLAIGILTILHDLWMPSRDPVTPWPYSVPVFIGGALFVEFAARVFAIPLLASAGSFLAKGRGKLVAYWIVAVIVALAYEPSPYWGELLQGGPAAVGTLLLILRLIIANLLGAWFYMKGGLLAPISLRLADYAVWHVTWPLLLL
jgi:hypothetical protein